MANWTTPVRWISNSGASITAMLLRFNHARHLVTISAFPVIIFIFKILPVDDPVGPDPLSGSDDTTQTRLAEMKAVHWKSTARFHLSTARQHVG
jgi:hypothetical protein